MLTLWYPSGIPAEIVSSTMIRWIAGRNLFNQQVQDWLNSRYPSFNHVKIILDSEYRQIDMTCSICWEQGDCISVCGHSFHRRCLDRWTLRSQTCPICRHSI